MERTGQKFAPMKSGERGEGKGERGEGRGHGAQVKESDRISATGCAICTSQFENPKSKISFEATAARVGGIVLPANRSQFENRNSKISHLVHPSRNA
jgi:hypothetical protein